MAAMLSLPEQKVILRGVSWETYERLLAEHEEDSDTHFTYDRGTMEIMVLSARHEKPNRSLASLVEVSAEAMALDVENFGSTTFKYPTLLKGFEPDSCFYIRHAALMRDKDAVDLTVDPAPDLIIDIAITSPSLDTFPIYAAVGVPEIWRYDGSEIHIYHLVNGDYQAQTYSLALPSLTSVQLTRFLEDRKHQTSTAWRRAVRTWARAHASSHA